MCLREVKKCALDRMLGKTDPKAEVGDGGLLLAGYRSYPESVAPGE